MNVHACLADPRRYERQIDRLHERYLFTRHLYELRADDVSLASIVLNRRRFARLLARTVENGEYELQPARIREIRVDGKVRKVFAYTLTDLIVHGVVSGIVEEAGAPLLSPRLYSYRKGVSWWAAIGDFATYVRQHRRSRPDPRSRGLFVLRRDVDTYTDSIPVDRSSPVWPLLDRVLGDLSPKERELVEHVVRPEARRLDGGLATATRGVPTGQPISCALFNLYLHELDHELAAVPGSFYARYSDDILFAHPDPEVTRAAGETIEARLAARRLTVNAEKRRDLYVTGAGRHAPGWRGTTAVPFLGTSIRADGTVGLNRKKLRRLLRDVESRAVRTAGSLRADPPPRRGSVVCSVVNRALDPRPGPFQQSSATLLRRAVTDRRQLAQIDYLLARIVAGAVTGDRSVRAFRRAPYRMIRQEWGLLSVLHARNTRVA